jgi:general transcription factor 3C polypeptide 3 (transcription factor C subunit 4)
MKLSDAAVKNPSILKWNPLNKRYGLIDRNKSDEVEVDDEEEVEGGVEDTERSSLTNEKDASAPPLPTKENPLIVSIYGQICIAAKSYQSAICAFMISSQSLCFECLLFKYQFIFCMHMIIIPTIR